MSFYNSSASEISMLVGLGNPGARYQDTRHNVGFMVIDALLQELEKLFPGCAEKILKPKGRYELWRVKAFSRVWLLVKPLTFMNLSGEAVGPLAAFYKLDLQNILAIHDELDLPLGRMKFKRGGGLAGHNGLKSLEAYLGSREFIRLRLGIDKPEQGEVINYVTSRFKAEESPILKKTLSAAVSALLLYMKEGLTQAMQEANAVNFSLKKSPAPENLDA